MKVIGLTGGVGAGKSTVLAYIEKICSAVVIQADQAGHLVMAPGERCYEPMIALFGKQIIKKDKTIDRRMVSDVVFGDERMRQKLNALLLELNDDLLKARRELGATNRRLRELDELKNMFLASATHDLKTPLTSIIGHGVDFKILNRVTLPITHQHLHGRNQCRHCQQARDKK